MIHVASTYCLREECCLERNARIIQNHNHWFELLSILLTRLDIVSDGIDKVLSNGEDGRVGIEVLKLFIVVLFNNMTRRGRLSTNI